MPPPMTGFFSYGSLVFLVFNASAIARMLVKDTLQNQIQYIVLLSSSKEKEGMIRT